MPTVADVVVEDEKKAKICPGVTAKYSPPEAEAGMPIPLGMVAELTIRLLVDDAMAPNPAMLEITRMCWTPGLNPVLKTVGPAPAAVGM